MKNLGCALLLACALCTTSAFAQNPVTFAWTGSTDSSNEVALTSVDNVPTSYTAGWGGGIQITNGYDLSLLSLPQPGVCSTTGLFTNPCPGITIPFLPNQSFMDCWSIITWDPTKYWGTRTDGTTMDGTQAGDFYGLNGAVPNCGLWNGFADINISKTHTFVNTRVCVKHVYRWCTEYAYELVDTYTGGVGMAVGTCTVDCP